MEIVLSEATIIIITNSIAWWAAFWIAFTLPVLSGFMYILISKECIPIKNYLALLFVTTLYLISLLTVAGFIRF
jgi:hypothetical protein